MTRRSAILAIMGLLSVAEGQVWAFPGQTGEELIRALGSPANGYVSPSVPTVESVRSGRAYLSNVYWSQATYDPFGSGSKVEGTLVTTFDYRGAGLVERLEKNPPELGWKDLVSRSEVFLSFVSPHTFQALLAAIEPTWKITSKTHQGVGTGYHLYSLISTDGRFQGEMSYAEKGEVPQPAGPPGHKPPTLNFWTRISAVR